MRRAHCGEKETVVSNFVLVTIYTCASSAFSLQHRLFCYKSLCNILTSLPTVSMHIVTYRLVKGILIPLNNALA